jgi:hypothetical protein
LERVALALLEREVLDGSEVAKLIAGDSLPAMPPPSSGGGTQQVIKPDGGRRLPVTSKADRNPPDNYRLRPPIYLPGTITSAGTISSGRYVHSGRCRAARAGERCGQFHSRRHYRSASASPHILWRWFRTASKTPPTSCPPDSFGGLKIAAKPADADHPYGHGRFEILTGSRHRHPSRRDRFGDLHPFARHAARTPHSRGFRDLAVARLDRREKHARVHENARRPKHA